ncbi:FAD-dependent oxidoreductase [Rhizobium sp. SYY.PMSO]|uniref:FAD-dependent oxidoreductase n=1 Tax=Rhizobium sp. SYY.PMSO TaxID=3382192 RepID=UPI00398FE2EA
MPTSAARNSAALGRILLGDDPAQILIQAAHQPDQRLDFIIAEAGQLALRRAGLYENFLKIARYEDQGSQLYDKDGTLIFADDGADESDRPEVDRTALRQMLLASLPAEMIRWDHRLHTVRPLDNGTYELVLESGTAGPFDLVVGADGSWSRVRPLVSSYRPQYNGITFIEFGIDDVDKSHPELAALVGRGKIGVEADGRGLIVQRNGNAHLRGYAIFRLIEAGNDHIVPRPIHALPVGHHWQNRLGITLLGDAAHVMSPFGGEGVNAAMLDAAELARQLLENEDWKVAVKTYEAEMFDCVIEPAEHAAEAVATELSYLGAELTLQHCQAHLDARLQGSAA